MNFYRLLSVIVALCLSLFGAAAQNQQPQTPEQKEKQLLEFVDKEVQRLSTLLKLEYWQEFYVDSTLTHDFKAMMEDRQLDNVDDFEPEEDVEAIPAPAPAPAPP